MSQRNKNNSIVFLTTLSVYLGLVLVGAAPQILAQQSEIISRQAKTVETQPEKDGCSELEFAEILKLLNKHDPDFTLLKFSYRTEFLENQPTKSQIIVAEGNKSLIDSLRQSVNCDSNRRKSSETIKSSEIGRAMEKAFNNAFPIANAFSSLSADNQEIVSEVTYTFLNTDGAKGFANFFNDLFGHARKIATPELIAENRLASAIFNNITFRHENNQVFMVIRLPRGTLDELLKDVKAESK